MEELAEAKSHSRGTLKHSRSSGFTDAGEDVATRVTTNRIELVGSLRPTKQSIQCHDIQRGQLLGAFSYEPLRDPPIQPE